jgi:hypothetical protein
MGISRYLHPKKAESGENSLNSMGNYMWLQRKSAEALAAEHVSNCYDSFLAGYLWRHS